MTFVTLPSRYLAPTIANRVRILSFSNCGRRVAMERLESLTFRSHDYLPAGRQDVRQAADVEAVHEEFVAIAD